MDPQPALDTYWNRPTAELLAGLHTSENGLPSAEAAQRLAQYGPNSLQEKRQVTPIGLFLNQFKSPIILILLFATGVSAILRDWVDAVIILIIVFGSAVLSFVQEYSAGNAAEKLRAQIEIKATAVRDGQPQAVPAERIVPGDVVVLSAGSLIPADGVLLEAKDFFVSQAVLTGETFPVEKAPGLPSVAAADSSLPLRERTNCVFMGTSVRSGTARMLVVVTGMATAFGQVAQRLTLRPPATEFERGIRRLGYLLSEVTLVLVLAVFAVNVFFHKPILDSLLFSLALAVGLTPQLLPAIININLSKGSQDMAKAGVIVRRLAAIENFGSMDVLCSDKTGTLTEGVVHLDAAVDSIEQPSPEVMRWACLNAGLQTGLANPLDGAIVAYARDHGLACNPDNKLDEIPYDFVRRRLSVVVREPSEVPTEGSPSRKGALMITKGALASVLDICTAVRKDGTEAPLDDAGREEILARYAAWSEQGYRVLGLATRRFVLDGTPPVFGRDAEQDLVFVGFLLFLDPPKPGVDQVVANFARLGVNLKVITGDNKLVALHVAQSIGLEITGVLTGQELDSMTDEALWGAVNQTNLFADVDPNQKERIILGVKKMGHVVGYMGDGINDAPALHAADVGISVDTAVDVAREAADFVLLKRDLEVLRQGIIEGRKTFANTMKYIFMATSANFGNMFSVAGASLFLPFLPMLPKQILLINFLTDLPEMTIANDNVDAAFLEQPRRWDIGFIRRFMLVFGPLSSLFDFLTFAVLLLLLQGRQAQFHTGWFVESVLSATLVVFVLRTRLPFFRSRPGRAMMAVTAVVAIVTLLIPYSPAARLLDFIPLPPLYLVMIAGIVVIYVISAEFTKRWFYRTLARG